MVNRMRSTSSHTGNRRSHHALKMRSLSACGKCGKPVLPHNACVSCGTYRGKQVVDIKGQLAKKAARTKRKAKERGESVKEAKEAKA